MKILALDLGTKTGFACSYPEFGAGTWELASPKYLRLAKKLRMDRRLDPRIVALWNKLSALNQSIEGLDYVFFEDVRFAHSQAQAHLWASFRGVVWAFAAANDIQVDCLDTGKLKKFATGSGAADKPAMARALCHKYPDQYAAHKGLVKDLKTGTLLDDDAVDALHLLDWAKSLLK